MQWNETKRKEVLGTQTQKRNVLDKAEYVVPGDQADILRFFFIKFTTKPKEVALVIILFLKVLCCCNVLLKLVRTFTC